MSLPPQIYQQLLQTSPSGAGYNVTDICDGTVFSAPTMTDLFGSGRCLMTVGLRDVFQVGHRRASHRCPLGASSVEALVLCPVVQLPTKVTSSLCSPAKDAREEPARDLGRCTSRSATLTIRF